MTGVTLHSGAHTQQRMQGRPTAISRNAPAKHFSWNVSLISDSCCFQGSGFRVQGSGSRVQGSGSRRASGFNGWGWRCRDWGVGPPAKHFSWDVSLISDSCCFRACGLRVVHLGRSTGHAISCRGG